MGSLPLPQSLLPPVMWVSNSLYSLSLLFPLFSYLHNQLADLLGLFLKEASPHIPPIQIPSLWDLLGPPPQGSSHSFNFICLLLN